MKICFSIFHIDEKKHIPMRFDVTENVRIEKKK